MPSSQPQERFLPRRLPETVNNLGAGSSIIPLKHTYFNTSTLVAMRVVFQYVISLHGLQRCSHASDCYSLRTNAGDCATCHVLFLLAKLHLACRCEWGSKEVSDLDDFVSLLPTSGFVQTLLSHVEEGENLDKRVRVRLWSLWRIYSHPIVHELRKQSDGRIRVQRSRPY